MLMESQVAPDLFKNHPQKCLHPKLFWKDVVNTLNACNLAATVKIFAQKET